MTNKSVENADDLQDRIDEASVLALRAYRHVYFGKDKSALETLHELIALLEGGDTQGEPKSTNQRVCKCCGDPLYGFHTDECGLCQSGV